MIGGRKYEEVLREKWPDGHVIWFDAKFSMERGRHRGQAYLWSRPGDGDHDFMGKVLLHALHIIQWIQKGAIH